MRKVEIPVPTLFHLEPVYLTIYRALRPARLIVNTLEKMQSTITLTIEDNGKLKSLPFIKNQGLCLLGIRERVNGLSGQFDLLLNESGGLTVKVTLPKPIMGKT